VSVPAAGGRTRAVFFDVDFTLIYPGPAFQGSGYREFCSRFGIEVDPSAFDTAVSAAATLLDPEGGLYDAQLYVDYTRRIIEGMGGTGPDLEAAARAIYTEWAACHHFLLYEDVPEVLQELHASGFKIGLITNSHRCLASFQIHFALEGLFSVTLSSLEHGYMKPHPSIFESALQAVNVEPDEAVMVGDSFPHDVEGARRLGMRGILVARPGSALPACPPDVTVIQSLRQLPALLSTSPSHARF
jgi:putative hydrolase of the HAD superfamily